MIYPFDGKALGRLFFSPQERRQLQEQPVSVVPVGHERDQGKELTANGWLQTGEQMMLWIDGRAQPQLSEIGNLDEGKQMLRIQWHGKWLELKPGQVATVSPSGQLIIEEFSGE